MEKKWEIKKSSPKPFTPQTSQQGQDKRKPQLEPVNYESIKWRINRIPRGKERFKTGIDHLDAMLGGGLPKGNTILYGEPGCGKSLLAREIAKRHKSLYFCCEVLKDAPDVSKFKNVTTVDYTVYQSGCKKAIAELMCLVENIKPDLVVVDSLTSFFSVSRKALPESEVREITAMLHQMTDGVIPVIGVSEVRGMGFNQSLAGGQGVAHACSMLIKMEHVFLSYENLALRYKMPLGDDVYTIRIVKDKDGLASRKMFSILLTGDGYELKEI